ncbi:MAG: RNA-binding S4 domain-containing protein [Roseburia sp.]|nr:RNA-binding S4 domain-containing protein [Roseburia sp.]
MEEIIIRDDFIRLGQALKLAGLVESGIDAKLAIQDGLVKVNGKVEVQRGKKLVDKDEVFYDGQSFVVRSKNLRQEE